MKIKGIISIFNPQTSIFLTMYEILGLKDKLIKKIIEIINIINNKTTYKYNS